MSRLIILNHVVYVVLCCLCYFVSYFVFPLKMFVDLPVIHPCVSLPGQAGGRRSRSRRYRALHL